MLVIPHLILRQKNRILLLRRRPHQRFWPGHWHCVTGTIEHGETSREAILREASEEIGIMLKNSIDLVTTISLTEKDYLAPENPFYAVELFFLADLDDDQVPFNKEPQKQDMMDWFFPTQLPTPMIPGVKFGIDCFLQGKNYGELRNI
jgi:ADP-ribose pyrophosphatase YjhB (NUDIX family)